MKKHDSQVLLAILTFVALFTIIIIQVYWLLNAAALEEKEFNHSVAKALNEAREEIGERVPKCDNMKNYLCGNPCHFAAQEKTIKEIDSIIHSKLHNYHIELGYKFDITDSAVLNKKDGFGHNCYLQSLNGLLEKNGIQIKLEFPDRKVFIYKQMKGTFLLASFAVIFVMISFILTLKMFVKEKRQLQHASDFINNMVHEFQTPIANIRLAANLLKKKDITSKDEKIPEYISVIIKENEKLEKHVKNILEVSSNGENNCLYEKVNLHNIIVETGKEFTTRLEGVNGKIEYSLNAKNHIINAVSSHFTLIFSNLIDNAIKYSKEPPAIYISTINRKNNVEICVKDNGIGIDTKDLPKIFDKYYRVSTGDVHNVKGFGLGLTYVKKIIEQYKGKIEVLSSKDSGTLFTIIIPLGNETNENITC